MTKSIFITGAAAGIGKATALMFADKGWYVGATDVDKIGLEKLKKTIGKNHYYSAMDVTDAGQVESVLSAFAENTTGKLNVLIRPCLKTLKEKSWIILVFT